MVVVGEVVGVVVLCTGKELIEQLAMRHGCRAELVA